MKIAFCLYKYFPFGGLQRDCLKIINACHKRGHEIRVYTMQWDDIIPNYIHVIIVPVKAKTNHGRNEFFYHEVKKHLIKYPVNITIGFNKMPDLDIYYAADMCYAEKVEKEKNFFYKLTTRYKHYITYEKAVFHSNSRTKKLLMLTQQQINDFKKHYKTSNKRFYMLPPGININNKYNYKILNAKEKFRKKNSIKEEDFLLLQVGSDFKRKGVDRTLQAISNLPNTLKNKTVLMVVGQDNPKLYKLLAKKLKIEKQVSFFYGRTDINELMLAADMLIHPAYQEAAGIVLIEAITAGLPVITTANCGYSEYIKQAHCGIVIEQPYKQKNLNCALITSLLNKSLLIKWSKSAFYFADTQDLYSLPEKAANIILGF
ncbi:MAG: glycosyltransferase family 4 protein [Arsenophonus sp.]|nr:MAG: glycosyltransferase family 4 protein [Arsenophonus sp.]